MEELEKLEDELNNIYNRLFDAEDPLEMEVLSQTEMAKYNKRAQELKTKIDEIYKEKLVELELEHPEVLKSGEVKKLYDQDAKSNYLIFCFLIKHPEIYSSTYITSEVGKFIYHCSGPRNCRDIHYSNVGIKIKILEKFQPAFYHYSKFIEFLNYLHFEYLYSYFQNESMMNNPRFIEFLLNVVQNPEENIDYMEYHYVEHLAEIALSEELDIEFVYALGNKQRFKKYLSNHSKEYFFDLISSINDNELKKKLLVDIFGLKNTKHLDILIKFFAIPEVQKQLLDRKSFYYQLLIEPLTHEDKNSYEADNELESACSEIYYDEGYASIWSVIEAHSEDFYDCEFDKMIHYFDKHVGNYIYFFYENEVKQVPVLYYIQTMKKKLDLWEKLNVLTSSLDVPLAANDAVCEALADYMEKDFTEFAYDALFENIDKCLSSEEEVYWNFLLKEAEYYKDIDDEKQLELKSAV